MTPDKIYLQRNTTTDLYDEFWPEWFEDTYHPERDICYIRKDTLLKWAKERKEQMKIEAGGCSNMLAVGEFLAYDKLIEQIQSM